MDISTGLFVIAALYCVLYFFDTFFKTCAHYPYIQFLQGTGFEVKLLQIRWCTTAFNRLLVRWGSSNTKFFNIWFNLGLLATLLLLPVAVVLLMVAIVQNFIYSSKDEKNFVIEPVLPGVNLPVSELGYYSFALVVCSVFHELGHALASVQEDVHISNVGVCVFLILPIAYVNISTESLNALNRWKALRILCAGVWHNLVLTLVAYLLYCILPFVFSLTFYTSSGVTIADLTPNSPLAGPKGLTIGDNVVRINDCVTTDDRDWHDCLQQMRTTKPAFCINADLVHTLDESVPLRNLPDGFFDCCGADKSDRVCFEYLDDEDGVVALPPHVCLPVRLIVESSPMFCNVKLQDCEDGLYCIRPVLNNVTNLFKIEVVGEADVVFIGTVGDLLYTVRVSPFVPKYWFRSTVVPDMVEKVLLYLIVFSFGLAFVNIIPCIFMDGQHVTKFLIQILLNDTPEYVAVVAGGITLMGTFLLLSHCLFTAYHMIYP